MAYKKRAYRKKGFNLSRKVNYLSKQVAKTKPELKQIEVSPNGPIGNLTDAQYNVALCEPDKGTNANQRIGDKIKAISYYGVFYFTMPLGTSEASQAVRLIHYLSRKPNETELEDNGGNKLRYNELPGDTGYIIKEDKLITLSVNGNQVRKLVIKGKYKYPINIKWQADNLKVDWHPRLMLVSNSLETVSTTKPHVNGQMRYYYTDA